MRRSRFTEEPIVSALKEHAAGASTKELCRRLGAATETLYNWKRKYGGLEVSEARRNHEAAKVTDLMAALKASVEAAKKRRGEEAGEETGHGRRAAAG
jgi:putative transposase